MIDTHLPLTQDLVLLGGGHAHALVLRRWAMRPLPGARLTLVDPNPATAYSGMLPGHVAGHYPRAALDIDLVRLARLAGARIILGAATGIDRQARRVQVTGRPDVAYDVLSVDVGVTSAMPDLPGFAAHGLAVKPLAAFATGWARFADSAPPGARLVILGGGTAAVELALAAAHRLADRRPHLTLVERGPALLRGAGAASRKRLLRHLARAGVTVLTGAQAARVAPDGVTLADGRHLPCDLVLGAAGARAPGWLAETGLPVTDGFIDVGPTLASTADPRIFAAGDCAHLTHAPRPKAGVFAVRAAPVLFDNLRAALGAGRARAFRPQRDYLRLVSTGGRGAVADKWGLALDGAALWHLKDRIDRRFMAMLSDLPAPPRQRAPAVAATGLAAELAGGAPLCGGCAAKMGGPALARALAALPAPQRPEVLAGAGDDAAVLATADGRRQVLTTDHLRAFVADPFVMARIAAVHALGDVWAMGATPQAVLMQVTLPRLSARLQERTMAEIVAAIAGITGPAGADILGGHTATGAELVIGLTVTGLCDAPVTLAGARPGDVLVLTKPLGTGVLMAAEMQWAARGADVAAALAAMQRPLAADSAILAPSAHAMTDVTGFGLAGHLAAMMAASRTAACIDAAALPLLPGAAACLAAGLVSSLHATNAAALPHLAGAPPVIFDPQTAGGLLAAVPEAGAADLLDRLRAAGATDAAVIGRVTAGAGVTLG